jgi:hypothetical protein
MEMKDRESTIVAIKREQADDRVRIQRLLSLSQPAIHDFSFVYEGEEPPTAELAEVRGIDWRNLQTLVHVPSSLPPLSQCTRGYAEYLARKARIIEVCGTGFEELGVECRARVAEAEADRESQVLHAERLQSDLVGGLHQRLSEVASVTKVATDEYLCLRHNSRVAHASSMKLKLRRSQAQREREGETKVRLERTWGSSRGQVSCNHFIGSDIYTMNLPLCFFIPLQMTERRTQTERLALGSEAARRLEEGLADARKSMLISARGLDLTKEHYSRLKAENQAQLENLQRQIATERRAYYDLCSRRKQHLPQLVQSLKAISASVKHEQFEAQLAALLGGK